jgi:hypothetical protein
VDPILRALQQNQNEEQQKKAANSASALAHRSPTPDSNHSRLGTAGAMSTRAAPGRPSSQQSAAATAAQGQGQVHLSPPGRGGAGGARGPRFVTPVRSDSPPGTPTARTAGAYAASVGDGAVHVSPAQRHLAGATPLEDSDSYSDDSDMVPPPMPQTDNAQQDANGGSPGDEVAVTEGGGILHDIGGSLRIPFPWSAATLSLYLTEAELTARELGAAPDALREAGLL